MDKKLLRINKNIYKELSFEEVLIMYNALIINYVKKFQAIYPQFLMEDEDLYQIFSMALYKAYNQYDINRKVGFGLVAKRYLTHKSMNISRSCGMAKRNNRAYVETQLSKAHYIRDIESIESLLNYSLIKDYINKKDGKEGIILKLILEDKTKTYIAEKANTSRQWINRTLRKHKKLILEELI